MFESQLGQIAGADDGSRIEVVEVVAGPGSPPVVELRWQRHAEELGWTTHKRLRLAPGAAPELVRALAAATPVSAAATTPVPPPRTPLRLVGG